MIDPLLFMLLAAATFAVCCGYCAGYTVRRFADERIQPPPPPAQAADSVLEDAARLKARHDFLLWNRSLQPSPIESSVEYSVFDKALELYDAARKQGGTHDNP